MYILTRTIPFLLVASLAASCASPPERVSRRDCERLRDHVIDLRMETVTADHDQHRAALRSALGESFLSSCAELTTEQQLQCSLKATSSDALAACGKG